MQDRSATDALQIDLRRVFRAPATRVFEAWTHKEDVGQWLCHDGHLNRVKVIKHDVRPHGALRLEVMRHTEPAEDFVIFGTYKELEPPRRLALTWAWERT